MSGWLLDTNVISELRRPKPEAKVTAFIRSQPLESLHVSVVTFAEIRFGIELLAEATRRAEFNTAKEHGLTESYRDWKAAYWHSAPSCNE